MNYQQTVDYLFSLLPMFHRIGAAAYKADLNNIIALSEILDHPEKKFRSVHIAGTNGKGSVSHMLASILQEAGYKTGLFTSPHMKDFRERVRIDGKMIGEENVIRFVEDHRQDFEDIKPSFFEWTTALAFEHFAKEKVDIAIIETGLGGRLDSTNIITPVLSVITNISLDHMQLLGDTIEKIAIEKAGIIKKNIPVVVGERQSECEGVFKKRATELKSDLFFASDNYKSERMSLSNEGQTFRINKNNQVIYNELFLDLPGNYQEKNICTVMQACEILERIFPKINEKSILSGLSKVGKNTGLTGRWQIISKNPMTIVDVAHNESGIKYVLDQLDGMMSTNYKKLHIVLGMVNDKDISSILSLFPKHATYYFCKADIPRALDAGELKTAASSFNLNGACYPSVAAALQTAQGNAEENDLVFVGGSTFVVAEAI